MLDELIWHGFGILCVAGIVALGRNIARRASALTFRTLVLSFFIGLFSGALGVIVFFILFIFASDYVDWLLDLHYRTRVCAGFLYMIFSAFIGGKAGAYLLRKYCSDTVVLSSALIAGFLLIFHPVGYIWLQWIGIL